MITTNLGQVNIANDNATIHAVQIVNYNPQEKPQKIMSPEPVPSDVYVSRGAEEIIANQLDLYKILLVNGIGGIGKTTVAKAVFTLLKEKYDHLAWIDYRDNWKKSIVNGLFSSFFHFDEKMTIDEKYDIVIEFLTNLQETQDGRKKRVVIFIDDYNEIDSGELLEIRRLPVYILITTRCNIPGISKFTLDALDSEKGRLLFKLNYGKDKQITFMDNKAIDEIVLISHGYPLAIELIAKAIAYNDISIHAFLKELKNKGYAIRDIKLSAISDWNGKYTNEDIAKQLSKVYTLSGLNHREESLIRILSLLPANNVIPIKDVIRCVDFTCNDTILSLCCRGWIKQSENGLIMHEVVCESVYHYNNITFEECKLLMDYLRSQTEMTANVEATKVLRYAEYTYNIIRIMQSDINFSKHLLLREAALIFKEAGQNTRSRYILDIIISAYDSNNERDKVLLAELHNNYSKTYSIEGDVDKALDRSLYAEKMIDSVTTNHTEEFYLNKMIIKKTVAMHYAHKKKFDQAINRMQEAIGCSSYIPEKERYQIANLYSDYSLLLSDIGDMSGSVEQYEKVLELYDEYGVTANNPWRYTTYTNFADSLIWNGQIVLANLYEFQALIGKYQLYREQNHAVANALLGMAHIYRSEKNLWDVSKVFYEKALNIYKGNINSDGYCDSLAGLSIVSDDVCYAEEAYEIIMGNDHKIYMPSTYTDVMEALLQYHPDKTIDVGLRMLSEYSNQSTPHTAIQYVYALMGEASNVLGNSEKKNIYLDSAIRTTNSHSAYYYRASQQIINKMPSIDQRVVNK